MVPGASGDVIIHSQRETNKILKRFYAGCQGYFYEKQKSYLLNKQITELVNNKVKVSYAPFATHEREHIVYAQSLSMKWRKVNQRLWNS